MANYEENPLECMNHCEQEMNAIMENKQEELHAFLFDHSNEHFIAKAYISFAMAYHFSAKEISQ